MSDPSASSPTLPAPPNIPGPVGIGPAPEAWPDGPHPPREGWTPKKFYIVLVLALVLHIGLIFFLGARNQVLPRSITNLPHLALVENADELVSLSDPTLFARPNQHDLVSAFWRRLPSMPQPDFNWTESPRYLLPDPMDFGNLLREFARNNQSIPFPLNFKLEPQETAPKVLLEYHLPQATTLRITGDLGSRALLNPIALPSLPRNDVIAPSRVRVLVDAPGNVASSVVLEPSADSSADQLALQLVRNLRFAPAPGLTFGDVTFRWHTVPASAVPAAAP